MQLTPIPRLQIYLSGLFLIASLSIFAQGTPTSIDSLKQQLKQHTTKDSLRINLLVSLADALVTANPKEAMHYADETFRLAQQIKSPMGIAAAYRQKALIFYHLNNYQQAVEYNYKALKAADNLIQDRKGVSLFRATVYNNLGGIYMNIGEYDKAIPNFNNFLKTIKELNEPELRRYESIALLNLGEVYSRKKDYRKSADYARQSLAIAEADKDYQIAAYNLMSQGVAYSNLKQTATAIASYKKGVDYANKAGDLKIKSGCIGGLADGMFDLKRYTEAEIYAKQAYQIAKDLNLLEEQRVLTQLLAYIDIAQKKGQSAITYLETSLALRDSILNDDKKQEIARQEERFEQEKRTAVLNAQHIAELKQKQTEQYALAGLAGVVLLASGGWFWFYKRKRDLDEQVKTEQLNALISDTELKVLRSQINPHFIFNALNSISYYVLNNEPFEADRYLTKFATLMRSILQNSDRAEVPLEEDMETLELYMELESLRLNHRFTYKIDIDPSLNQQHTMIPPLLLQPFVENSIWHGLFPKESDGLITIRIWPENDRMICTVTDNGIGREKAATIKQAKQTETSGHKSQGLSITEARLEVINRLKKSDGFIKLLDLAEGTEVAVTLPLVII